jgi:hypothetical protein
MIFNYKQLQRMNGIAFLILIGILPVAHAEDDDDIGQRSVLETNAKWKTECSACHIAFPPRLLPAESWRAIMSSLNKHFSTNASLDAPTIREIGNFLEKNSGQPGRETSGKSILRITDTRWFKHEHSEMPANVWKNPKIKSPANCAACHLQAERGNYSEHNIRIPK